MSKPPDLFAITVDLVVLTVRDDILSVLLVTRGTPPFKGYLALPGGFVRDNENLVHAATRELVEETSISAGAAHLEQLATYGEIERDPRGRVVTVAYLVLLPELPTPVAGTDAAAAAWYPVSSLLDGERRIAFDHLRILSEGVERARAKLEYSSLAAEFCPPEFTIGALRRVYEAVWGTSVDPRNFHRKVTGTSGFVEATDKYTDGDRGRPAQLYRKGKADVLYPPLMRR